MFAELTMMGYSIVKLDFNLLGDMSKRDPFAKLLGSERDQKLRLFKLLALRETIRYSAQTQICSEIDRKLTKKVASKRLNE